MADAQSTWYEKFTMMEVADTKLFLQEAGIGKDDTVLVTCCGPGRETVAAGQLAKSVTAFDHDPAMLDAAKANASKNNLSNVKFKQIDWNAVLPGQNMDTHDVVLALRGPNVRDVRKLSELARRRVVAQLPTDAPTIPQLLDVIYDGCGAPEANKEARESGGAQRRRDAGRTGHLSFMKLANAVYRAGHLPNIRIMPERFRRSFSTRSALRAFFSELAPERAAGNEERVLANVTPFLTTKNGGIEFCIETRTALVWWDV